MTNRRKEWKCENCGKNLKDMAIRVEPYVSKFCSMQCAGEAFLDTTMLSKERWLKEQGDIK